MEAFLNFIAVPRQDSTCIKLFMINYRKVIIVRVNSYGYHEGYGTGIRVLTLNVLATTDNFMHVR